MIDSDDRRTLGAGIIRLAALAFTGLTLAATAGVAVRVFVLVSGV